VTAFARCAVSSLTLVLGIGVALPSTGWTQSRDSAGIFIAVGPREDTPLSWQFHERVRIGDTEDAAATFFQLAPWTIASDAQGRIYALDLGDARVTVLDSAGNLVRTLGRQGGGPGEFRRPVGLAVWPDGTIAVSDAGKRALVRFDAAGAVLEQQPLPDGYPVGPVRAVDDGVVMGWPPGITETVGVLYLAADTLVELARLGDTVQVVQFPQCGIGLSGVRPIYAPSIHWAAWGPYTIVSDSVAYRLDFYQHDRLIRSIRRPLPPRKVTRAEARQAPGVANGLTIEAPPRPACRVSPDQVVEARGYARERSVLQAVALAPNGELWVRRLGANEAGSVTDVFTATGRYLGTLPAGTPAALAFLSSNTLVTIRATPLGVPFLVVVDIERG
jgi:hypothetical protein